MKSALNVQSAAVDAADTFIDTSTMPDAALPALPSDADLRRLVHFSAGDGRIWLAGQRMVLVHAAALGALRRELMQTIGAAQTRRLLLRAGYASGERDAALARQVRGEASLFDMFAVGPQLHMLEGAVQVTPEAMDIDVAAGQLERSVPGDAGPLYDELQRRSLSLEALEDALIHEAVARAGGNLAAAARALGLTRPQLSYRLQRAHERAQQ